MNPAKHPARDEIKQALIDHGDMTQNQICEVTKKSADSVRNVLSRGAAAGHFRWTGRTVKSRRGYAQKVWTVRDPSPAQAVSNASISLENPIRQWKQETIPVQRAVKNGVYEVRYTNKYGFTVTLPRCYSRDWADHLAAEVGGRVIAVAGKAS